MKRHLAYLLLVGAGAVGCSDDPQTPAPPADELLAPPPAGQGVQFAMQTTIAAGTEAEHCRFVRAPAEGLWVNRDEVRFTAGSHHFLLYETAYDDIPVAKDDGTPVDTAGVFDCSDGATNGWSVSRLVGGSQNATGDSALRFPSDVALRVRPGAVLMMNAHYVNTQAVAIEPEVRINLWTIPEAQVRVEGDILFWYDIFIEVPEMGRATARMRCNVPEDITVVTAQSHMHRRGVGYEARFVGEAMPFYFTDAWENVPVTHYPDGFTIPGGTDVEYFCDYDNAEARTVYQGPRSSDEMCMLIAGYYPRVEGLGLCAADPERPWLTNALGAEWIGQGSATCAETVDCVQNPDGDFFLNQQSCVNDADPAVSREVSDAVRCLLISFADGADPFSSCATELDACLAK
jgi:hypothetical protein